MRAFSLVELSIVLVILGLLTGGILAGQSLIRAAELRSIPTEYSRYAAATYTFRDKYMAIPGDMRDATRFWGYQGGTGCTNNSGTSTTSPGTCDGNGDGLLSAATVANQSAEMFQLWRHLALAGLIEGSYTGLAGTGGITHTVSGSNAPSPKFPNAGWTAIYHGTYPGGTSLFKYDYGNALNFGLIVTDSSPYGKLLKPEEAWNIDMKLDDGKPGSGKLIARYWNNECSVADNGSPAFNNLAASYKLDETSAQCSLYFVKAF